MSEVPKSEEFYAGELRERGEHQFRAAYPHSFFELSGVVAALVGSSARSYVPIKGGKSLVSIGGREGRSDVYLPFADVPKFNSMVLLKGREEYIFNHRSVDGTYVDGEKITEPRLRLLVDGARVSFSPEPNAPHIIYRTLDSLIIQLAKKEKGEPPLSMAG